MRLVNIRRIILAIGFELDVTASGGNSEKCDASRHPYCAEGRTRQRWVYAYDSPHGIDAGAHRRRVRGWRRWTI